MSVAQDGSFGVLVVKWRMRDLDGGIFVLEQFGDEVGVLYGPIEGGRPEAHKFIRKRAGSMWAPFKAARDEIAATGIIAVRAIEKAPMDRLPAEDAAA